MILAGIALGPELGNLLATEVLENANTLRIVAVMIILMKAGLGSNWNWRERLFLLPADSALSDRTSGDWWDSFG